MSDMTFKQAKDIVERLELAELSIRNSFDSLDHARRSLDDSMMEQKKVLKQLPEKDSKIKYLYLVIMLNLGFIAGLFVGKYLL
jgi:F0F1-type ATP synthase assembly protein I